MPQTMKSEFFNKCQDDSSEFLIAGQLITTEWYQLQLQKLEANAS